MWPSKPHTFICHWRISDHFRILWSGHTFNFRFSSRMKSQEMSSVNVDFHSFIVSDGVKWPDDVWCFLHFWADLSGNPQKIPKTKDSSIFPFLKACRRSELECLFILLKHSCMNRTTNGDLGGKYMTNFKSRHYKQWLAFWHRKNCNVDWNSYSQRPAMWH